MFSRYFFFIIKVECCILLLYASERFQNVHENMIGRKQETDNDIFLAFFLSFFLILTCFHLLNLGVEGS